jgi:hypothetical protein
MPSWPPDTDQILDLVAGGVLQRADRFRYLLTDKLGTEIGEVHPDMERDPTVTWDTNRTKHRSLNNVRLPASEQDAINPLRDRLVPQMVLQNDTPFQLGVFLFEDRSRPVREWGREQHVQLFDKMRILDQKGVTTSGSPAKANVVQRAVDYARTVLNPAEIDAVSHPQTLRAPLLFTPSDTVQGIIDAHLALVGYLPCHFNREGRLQIRPAPLDLDKAPAQLEYEHGGRIERDSIVESDDQLGAPNLFMVYDSTGTGTFAVGKYRIPASAPHSFENRGYEERRVESMQGLENAVQATAAAKTLATTDRKATFDWRTWTSSLDPRHDAWNVCKLLGVNYLEVAWEMQLSVGGRHTHQARRVW